MKRTTLFALSSAVLLVGGATWMLTQAGTSISGHAVGAADIEARLTLAEPDPSGGAVDDAREEAARVGPMWQLDVQKGLAAQASELHACFTKYEVPPGLVGTKVQITALIGKTGVVVGAEAAGEAAEQSMVGICLRTATLEMQFTKRATGKTVQVTFPVTIRPGDDAAPMSARR